ncbi:MAG: hypothetical protein WBP31_01645 [Chitinophagales bacterium]|nr:hypothetical protein [Chitinophagales bacterium]
MKGIIVIALMALSLHLHAQDSTKSAYLGILTLAPFYQQDSNWTDADGAIIGAHFVRLQQLAKEGKIELAGRVNLPSNDPNMFGIVLILPTTLAEAEKIMLEDPAVTGKIMSAKILPFNIAVQKSD